MALNIFTANGQQIAEVIAAEVVINDVHDALDLMVNAGYQGVGRMIVYRQTEFETRVLSTDRSNP